ncbi:MULTISPECIES: MurR/RpiR family transcriptional regulator [Brevibacillus]|uniref:MurR/RpiR family transcriptional regulator n=1 Tax=Brevibacillus TaxID=55080 RepID=UPI002631BAB0|nr:MurR/RpiR family transcriptional regulator [Brevibacillus nitrificans]MED1793703.1 MurR/RpiR family transcriptional regulator [Brevibacillus nitrificans]
MQEQTTFENLVKEKFNGLSAAQRKVAAHLLQHLDQAAFNTVVQIAREAEVSETTVIRLSYALGFSGFTEMQGKIQQQIVQGTSSAQQSNRKPNPSVFAGEENLFRRTLENEIAIMQHNLTLLNEAEMWKAVDVLTKADHILIIGHRGSHAAANWLSFVLGMVRENVDLCPASGNSYEKLFSMNENSAAIVISFPRYSKESYKIAEAAKMLGCKLIAVTDRLLSPVGRISDITLLSELNVDINTGNNSMAAVHSILHMLSLGIMARIRDDMQERQERMEQVYSSQDLFIE